jgi:hypothetical protein
MAALVASMKHQLASHTEKLKPVVQVTGRVSPLLTLLRLRAGYRSQQSVLMLTRAGRLNLVSVKA